MRRGRVPSPHRAMVGVGKGRVPPRFELRADGEQSLVVPDVGGAAPLELLLPARLLGELPVVDGCVPPRPADPDDVLLADRLAEERTVLLASAASTQALRAAVPWLLVAGPHSDVHAVPVAEQEPERGDALGELRVGHLQLLERPIRQALPGERPFEHLDDRLAPERPVDELLDRRLGHVHGRRQVHRLREHPGLEPGALEHALPGPEDLRPKLVETAVLLGDLFALGAGASERQEVSLERLRAAVAVAGDLADGDPVQEDARSPSQLLDDAARGLEHPRENRPHIDQAVPERHFPSSLALPTLPTAGPNGEGGGGGALDPARTSIGPSPPLPAARPNSRATGSRSIVKDPLPAAVPPSRKGEAEGPCLPFPAPTPYRSACANRSIDAPSTLRRATSRLAWSCPTSKPRRRASASTIRRACQRSIGTDRPSSTRPTGM